MQKLSFRLSQRDKIRETGQLKKFGMEKKMEKRRKEEGPGRDGWRCQAQDLDIDRLLGWMRNLLGQRCCPKIRHSTLSPDLCTRHCQQQQQKTNKSSDTNDRTFGKVRKTKSY